MHEKSRPRSGKAKKSKGSKKELPVGVIETLILMEMTKMQLGVVEEPPESCDQSRGEA